MKIWIEKNVLKDQDIALLKEKYRSIEWVTDEKDRLDSDVIMAMPGVLKNEFLDQFKHLKWIQLLSAGYDTIDQEYLKRRKIMLSNAPDVYSIAIAEDVFSKILFFNRNIKGYLKQMEIGLWKNIRVNYEICESTVGILGAGSIGREVAKRMKAFGATTLGYKRSQTKLEYFDEIYTDQKGLEEIYRRSDYLIITMPSSPETKNMVDEKAFSLMKEGLLLINVSRGDVVDQNQLIKALKEHKIRAAGLDVMVPEPLPKDHELWRMENVFITPHNSVLSPHLQKRLRFVLERSLDDYLGGHKLPNTIV